MAAQDLETIFFTGPDGSDCMCPHETRIDRIGTTALRTCKRRFCPRCGQRWGWDWRRVMEHNLRAYGGPIMVIALTPPGTKVLPWGCTRDHEHSGAKHGCQVDHEAGSAWAQAAPKNWKALRDAARLATVRALGLKPTLLERVWEPQKRGIPHLHIVLGMKTEEEKIAAHRFLDELERLAPDYLFGYLQGKREETGPEEAARYLTGYLLGRSKRKSSIRENIADPRMPRSLVWLTPALTSVSPSERIRAMRERMHILAGTGVTMRTLRAARWVIAFLDGKCEIRPRIPAERSYEVSKACVAMWRVKILNGARGPDDADWRERKAALEFVRAFRRWRLEVPAAA